MQYDTSSTTQGLSGYTFQHFRKREGEYAPDRSVQLNAIHDEDRTMLEQKYPAFVQARQTVLSPGEVQ